MPSFIHRARVALKAFKYGPGSFDRSSLKANPLRYPVWRVGKPEWQIVDVRGFIEEGFSQNSLVYSAVMFKARAAITAPLRAFLISDDPDSMKPAPRDHPLSQLLRRPNPYQSGAEFAMLNTIYQNVTGSVYIHIDRERRGGPPTALRTLRPDRVYTIPSATGLMGYLYVPEGESIRSGFPLLVEDVIVVTMPNPHDELDGMGPGMSPMMPSSRSIDVDNSITRFLKVFFDHGGNPNHVLQFEQVLDDTEVARIRNRWSEIYGGVDNWAEIGVLDNKAKVERLGYNFEEMSFEAQDERNEARILGPYGVPPILIGARLGLKHATYSNFEQARQLFWQDTFVPELNMLEEEWQFYLEVEGATPKYDFSKVPALQVDIGKQIDGAKKLYDMGVPPKIAFSTVGMDVDDYEGIDETGAQRQAAQQQAQIEAAQATPPQSPQSGQPAPRSLPRRTA